jgi:hypothetical protein
MKKHGVFHKITFKDSDETILNPKIPKKKNEEISMHLTLNISIFVG